MAQAGLISHMVYFTLKDSSQAACDHMIAQCNEFLTNHPGTVFYAAGTLADYSRPVNDREFHVALNVVFADRESHDKYQVAPRHEQFIQANRENWAKVRVFDAVVQTP